MVFGVPCITIVVPVCDRVDTSRQVSLSRSRGHLIHPGRMTVGRLRHTWVLQESQASVHAHSGVTPFVVSGWPLLFEHIYDISGLQHVNKLTIERRFRKYSL